MPGWLRDPIQIPRVSSSGPARFLPPLLPTHSLSLPPPTLFVHGVVIAGGVIALARDLSNNLLCTIPPRHTTTVRLAISLALEVNPLSFLLSLTRSLTFFCQGNRGSKALGRKIRKIEWILIRECDYPN